MALLLKGAYVRALCPCQHTTAQHHQQPRACGVLAPRGWRSTVTVARTALHMQKLLREQILEVLITRNNVNSMWWWVLTGLLLLPFCKTHTY